MALSKSGKAGSNVTQLDAVRKKRSTKGTSEKDSRPASPKRQSTKPVGKSAANKGRKSSKAKGGSNKLDDGAEKDKAATPEKPVEDVKAKAKPRVSNRRFDTEKVERIKAAIGAGEYEINYLQVADKFIEHERYA